MKTIIIAELSCNFLGDINLAKEMILAARENGADFAKFQTWEVSKLAPGPWDHDGRRSIYEKAELSKDQHFELSEFCRKNNIGFLTSCFCIDHLDFIRKITNVVKIPSPECRKQDLVKKASSLFDFVYMSTGASNIEEIFYSAKLQNVYLLHAVSTYPCPADKININRIKTLMQLTPRVGYSGHFFGIWDAIAAISLGAQVVEKHFTINRDHPYRDNRFAILPEELKKIRDYADTFSLMSINKGTGYQECEQDIRNLYTGRWG